MKPRTALAIIVLSIFASVSAAQNSTSVDKKSFVEKARNSYYSLKDVGVVGFNCKIQPDWDTFYKNAELDEVGRTKLIPMLKETQFEVNVGANGAASVSRRTESAPETMDLGQRFTKTSNGLEQMVTGFFNTWSNFMFASPLPGDGEAFEFESIGEMSRISMTSGEALVVFTVAPDYAIKTMRAKTPQFDITLGMKLEKTTNNLFYLSGYESTIPAGDAKQEMAVEIAHQDIQGAMLPDKVRILIKVPEKQIQMNFSFVDCKVKRQ